MTENDYYVRGCTALLDAVGGAIHHIGNVHKYARDEDRTERTLFIITTDGMENASRRYSYERVRDMIGHQKRHCGWEFIFLGANIDAVEVGSRMGIDNDHSVEFTNDSIGQRVNYEAMSEAISHVRACGAPLGANRKASVEKDRKSRRGCSKRGVKNSVFYIPLLIYVKYMFHYPNIICILLDILFCM